MSKIKCFSCGEYGHFTQDCPKAHDNANIAQESEQNKKVENMLDLDNISVSKECAMMCTEVQYEDEDEDEDVVVYGDQGTSTEENEKAMYGKLTKTQSEKKKKLSIMWPYTQMTVCHWRRKGGNLTKQCPMKMYMMLVRVMVHLIKILQEIHLIM